MNFLVSKFLACSVLVLKIDSVPKKVIKFENELPICSLEIMPSLSTVIVKEILGVDSLQSYSEGHIHTTAINLLTGSDNTKPTDAC